LNPRAAKKPGIKLAIYWKAVMEKKVMHKNSGFSLFELMTTIGIIAVLAAIAIPNVIAWRSGSKLQSAVENLRGDMQLAKLKAVQENGAVAVLFTANGYQVFTDGGPTQEGAFHAADNERRFRNRQLPAGVSIDLGGTDFNGNDYVRFNNRGLPEDTGSVVVDGSGGSQRLIGLNRLGNIDIN
jgi:type IV fimbrial biogenesis protein FimT